MRRDDEVLSIRIIRDEDEDGNTSLRLQVWQAVELTPDGVTSRCYVDEDINLNPRVVS